VWGYWYYRGKKKKNEVGNILLRMHTAGADFNTRFFQMLYGLEANIRQ
jgi:hypothetical protein